MMPACGQGVIAIECLKSNTKVLKIIKKLEDYKTKLCCKLERRILSSFNGDCKSPLGIHVYTQHNKIKINNMISNYDGSKILKFNFYYNYNEHNKLDLNLYNKFLKYKIDNVLKQ